MLNEIENNLERFLKVRKQVTLNIFLDYLIKFKPISWKTAKKIAIPLTILFFYGGMEERTLEIASAYYIKKYG